MNIEKIDSMIVKYLWGQIDEERKRNKKLAQENERLKADNQKLVSMLRKREKCT